MPKLRTPYVLSQNLGAHPAVVAFRQLQEDHGSPKAIHVLKDPRGKDDHTGVYRLHLGREGAAVIAKRCCGKDAALLEYHIYETILPALSVAGLRAYGAVTDPGGLVSWLFLEEATGAEYSSDDPSHRELGAEYLAALHTRSEGLATTSDLPDRGPEYYRELIGEIQDSIGRKVANPALTPDDVHVLDRIRSQFDALLSSWSDLESACSSAPRTLVHGDFVGKNVRVQSRAGRNVVLAFDWEQAGWSVPAIDVIKVDLEAYWRRVERIWTDMTLTDLLLIRNVGTVFRSIAAAGWAAQSLHLPWVDDAMDKMRAYDSRLTRALEAAPWVD
jgi:hypothetical protein